jgi:hypothetical protein
MCLTPHESKGDNTTTHVLPAYAQNFIASTVNADTVVCCPSIAAL